MSFGIPVRNGLMLGLGASTALSTRTGIRPAMSLNFLQPFLDSRITFSRGTNATLIDSTGRLTYAPNNIITWSEDFANATWAPVNCTKTTGQIDPNGGTTACRLTATADSGQIFRTYGATLTGNAINSIYIRRVTGSGTVWLFSPAVGLTALTVTNAWTRVNTGSVAISGSGSTGIRLAVSGDAVDVAFAQTELVTYQTIPSTYVATTASAYYGPRFDYDPVTLAPRGLLIEEARTNLLTYSDDFGNAAWTTLRGTVATNVTASPDGSANADRFTEDATANTRSIGSAAVTVVAGATHTISMFLKNIDRRYVSLIFTDVATGLNGFLATFDLQTGTATTQIRGTGTVSGATITPAGNGWYRCSVSGTVPAVTSITVLVSPATTATPVQSTYGRESYTGDGIKAFFLYGAQLEAGSFATSYIPTVASTVTRNADVATMTGTNFSSWYNQSEGTFVSDFDDFSVGATFTNVYRADDGTTSNRLALYKNGSSTSVGFDVTTGGVAQANIVTATASIANPTKHAAAYKTNDFAASVNGGSVATDTSGTVPSGINTLRIGRDTAGGAGTILNGHIRTIAYFNTRLPNAQLQTLTAPSLATTLSLDFTSGSYNVGF